MYNVKNTTVLTYKGAQNSHDADVHRQIINRQFHRESSISTTLSSPSAKGSISLALQDATGFAVGQFLHIQNGNYELVHPQIKSLVGNVATIDRPLDYDYAAGTNVNVSILNMRELGTIIDPISYRVQPYAWEIMHIKKISLAMGHGTAGDFGTFGNIAGGLANGMVLRRYDGESNSFASSTIWKNNGDIDLDTGTVKFPYRSGGGGTYGTSAVGRFEDAGAIVYLDGSKGDYMELLVQDDLTGLAYFTARLQGHYEGS